ncbi:MAG: flagellar biosynthesis protein FliQ [Rhodobacter sp. CACIA14H1]|nr:MAG: flagellar biosynthesis protein FliQ [Rhodobacter sp. CACIA14H1]
MTEGALYDALRAALWISVQISAPLLGVALLTGLAIGLLQALTSIQEATLTFVPKLAAMLAAFWLSMGFMTVQLVDFFHATVLPAVAGE